MSRKVITSADARALISAPQAEGSVTDESSVTDGYVGRIVKYIPSEIVAAYFALDNILKADKTLPESMPWILFVILLILTPIWMMYVTNYPKFQRPNTQIILATISFFVWVFALGGPFVSLGWYRLAYGSIALILYTIVSPILGSYFEEGKLNPTTTLAPPKVS